MLAIVVAVAKNGAIGKENKLLARIPEDLKRFREITQGKKVLMGRKTFESIGRALPRRENIVFTRNEGLVGKRVVDDFTSVEFSNKIVETFEEFANSDEIAFVIGGDEIYNLAMGYCMKLYVTHNLNEYEADSFFPEIDDKIWKSVCKSEIFESSVDDTKFYYEDYERKY